MIPVIIEFAKAVIFSPMSVGLLVGLSAGFNKNYWMDFYETWMEDGSDLEWIQIKGLIKDFFLTFINIVG